MARQNLQRAFHVHETSVHRGLRRRRAPRLQLVVESRAASRSEAAPVGGATLGSAALGGATVAPAQAAASSDSSRGYGPLLQGPFDFPSASRATVRTELVKGRMWSFEQVQGVIYVHVPVRMTVVKLDGGGLFVYAPVAPTAECLRLLAEIEAEHGAVEHILLPTLAIEHKDFAGAFASKRPRAQLWVPIRRRPPPRSRLTDHALTWPCRYIPTGGAGAVLVPAGPAFDAGASRGTLPAREGGRASALGQAAAVPHLRPAAREGGVLSRTRE